MKFKSKPSISVLFCASLLANRKARGGEMIFPLFVRRYATKKGKILFERGHPFSTTTVVVSLRGGSHIRAPRNKTLQKELFTANYLINCTPRLARVMNLNSLGSGLFAFCVPPFRYFISLGFLFFCDELSGGCGII